MEKKHQTLKELPISERPYEKCEKSGVEALSDAELLAVVLRSGTKDLTVVDLSKQILSMNPFYEGLLGICHTSREELQKIPGIGKVKAMQILCIAELSKRLAQAKVEDKISFHDPSSIADYYMEQLRHLEQENLVVMFLDTKCHLIKDMTITKGTVNQSLISSREIFVEALRCDAVNIILIHNHPSGDCTPSRDDMASTLAISKAGKIIGINVLDHIIIGDRSYSSLRELKLMK